MGWTPSRGRPRTLPRDSTPLRGWSVDARARIAWLLRVSRAAGPHHGVPAFTAALGEHGVTMGPSHISRYETGAMPVPTEVIKAYEQVLGLPAGQLLGACHGIDRLFGPALANDSRARPLPRMDLMRRLTVLEAKIDDQAVSGMEWLGLAEELSHPAGMLLPPSVLHTWIGVLVTQTMRSIGHAHSTRRHALARLVGDPHIQQVVVEQVEDASDQPGAQGVIDVLSVLADTTDPVVLRRLIGHVGDAAGQQQRGAAFGLLTAITRGNLPADLVPELTQAILAAAKDGPARGIPAFRLAQRISPQLTAQVVASLGQFPAPSGPGARVQSPARLGAYLTAAGQASGLQDPMVERLLREGLSPDFLERRHQALLLLAASPYRQALADTALQVLADPHTRYAGAAAATVLTYLAGPSQQPELTRLLPSTSGRDRAKLLRALAHSGGVPRQLDLLEHAADPQLVASSVYAAGMSNHPDLPRLATDPEWTGTPTQASAIWWQHTGPAITDPIRTAH
ncbi:hypothetical protein [Leekyejoonella antrihumi]|uniref:HTH cro/C1-type domain-containing protein n=1 Tax=Leekyejoonella antrihumi TaxID=1660198 RepID=A0A563E7S2_9MICO|nr:hypothetical protein [Leekyejoonella antrihumi]TWP38339.1 hypothetical protein FGL98_03785 [Leekyejoonella antrihumi]